MWDIHQKYQIIFSRDVCLSAWCVTSLSFRKKYAGTRRQIQSVILEVANPALFFCSIPLFLPISSLPFTSQYPTSDSFPYPYHFASSSIPVNFLTWSGWSEWPFLLWKKSIDFSKCVTDIRRYYSRRQILLLKYIRLNFICGFAPKPHWWKPTALSRLIAGFAEMEKKGEWCIGKGNQKAAGREQ